jgi:DHH family
MSERITADIDGALERACTAIRGASDVALACHVSPDGDALGSMLGLYHVLRHSAIECVASFPTPFIVAPHYRKLPGLDRLTPPHEFPPEPDVMVTFDCGALSRLGDLEQPAKAAHELIVIDHQRDRPGRRCERHPRASSRRPSRHAAQPRRRRLPVHGDRVRYGAVPVRLHDPRGLRHGA